MTRKSVAVLLTLLLALPFAARAQSGVVAGTVIAESNQRELAGVQIGVVGMPGVGAVSDASGRFRITGLTGATVVLHVRLLGYRPITDTVRVGSTTLRFVLAGRALELNQLVVTGTAGGEEKRALGTSVAAVNVADVMAQTSIPSVEALLVGRTPGVTVIPTSGQVGAGSQIRVRGIGTFSLSSTPLVYVDGIRTDNGQTGLVARFNDFDPEEIENIEVLKGPAAATLYGTEAARACQFTAIQSRVQCDFNGRIGDGRAGDAHAHDGTGRNRSALRHDQVDDQACGRRVAGVHSGEVQRRNADGR